jgi:asparagine synthase (glutamine-hydrolysing)
VAALPDPWAARLRSWRRRWQGREPWLAYSAIQPAFARRIRLADRMAAERHDPTFSRSLEPARAVRARMLGAVKGEFGETGAAHGITVCDPTADWRVVRFCLSLPEDQFLGPHGERRWLIRRAMTGQLPPDVLWNPRRGRQAADLALRLRAHVGEVDAALALCQATPGVADYLDVPHMVRTWADVRTRADANRQRGAFAILTRGLMAGLFLAEHHTGRHT